MPIRIRPLNIWRREPQPAGDGGSDPIPSAILRRFMRTEGRMASFYAGQYNHCYATNRIMLNSYSMTFDGTLLERGFWLYVWDIRQDDDRYLYVGRTGDSSSANASSPFNRIGQHLDFRANAKGNALGKQLRRLNVQPSQCTFEMLAIGPIFPEQETFELHKPIRDTVGALESALADELANRGYNVIGTHGRRVASDTEIWAEVLRHTNAKFPPLNVA